MLFYFIVFDFILYHSGSFTVLYFISLYYILFYCIYCIFLSIYSYPSILI